MQTIRFFILIFVMTSSLALANNDSPAGDSNIKDSIFVFKPARPVLDLKSVNKSYTRAYGLDLTFSNNGFGFGIFYSSPITEKLHFNADMFISNARNTDEFDNWLDTLSNSYKVFGKVNRLFMMPLTVGLKQYVLTDKLTESFKPYISAAGGLALIMSTPYDKDFFSAFKYSRTYTRFASYVAAGATLGTISSAYFGVELKYYYIPFGGKGLESIKNRPITDFGGVFISLYLGGRS